MSSPPTRRISTTPPPAGGTGRNGLATSGFTLGLFGLVLGWIPFFGVLFTVPAIAMSHAGRRRFRSGRAADQDLSTAGIVLGWLGTGFCLLASVLMIAGGPSDAPSSQPAAATPVLIAVPNVVGMSDAQARATLRAAGFTTVALGSSTGAVPGVAAGTVTEQRPGATAFAGAGDPILLGETAAPPLPVAAPTAQPVPTAAPARPLVTEPDVDRPRDVIPPSAAPQAPSAPLGGYKNCDAARAAHAAPLHEGDPGYSRKLDRDGDGTACEWDR